MSLLPQRKKSAGEIAKLRESLGIAGPPPGDDGLPVEPEVPALDPKAGIPASAPVSGDSAPKPVRSQRKSEQVPSTPVKPPAADSRLPAHRHSDRELNELRRQAAIAMQAPVIHPKFQRAHAALVIPGYLFAIGGAACFYYYELEMRYTGGCVLAALAIAAFIALKKPLSLHHAAFIAVTCLFVIVFGALYYFPQLRHGT